MHLIVFAVGVGFVAFAWIDRREVFSRLKYPVLEGELALPYGWAIAAIVLLLIQFRRSAGRRFLRLLQFALAACIAAIVIGLLCGHSHWVRYQVYRLETFGKHYQITARDRDTTEVDLVDAVDESKIGQWIRQDAQMLKHLADNRGDLFARRPDEARTTLASLGKVGSKLDDLLAQGSVNTFLLYALAGEIFVDDETKNWSSSQSSKLLNRLIQQVDSISDQELEALFFCVANLGGIVDETGQQRVQSKWLERVPHLQNLLGEGFRLGDIINDLIQDEKAHTVRIIAKEGYGLPYEAKRDHIDRVLNRSLVTLIRLAASARVEVVPGDADLAITLHLNGESLYQYQQQIMEWRSEYKPGRIRSTGGSRLYVPGKSVKRLVPSGETRTRTVLGATVAIEVPVSKPPIKTTTTLAYWADFLRDKDNPNLDSVDYDELSGRVWPLGIHQSYFLASCQQDADVETQNNQ